MSDISSVKLLNNQIPNERDVAVTFEILLAAIKK